MANTAGVSNIADPKEQHLAVNGSGGAYITVSASIFAGYVEITEEPTEPYVGGAAFTGQGLSYQRADENYANTYPLAPGDTIKIGDERNRNHCVGVPAMTMADGSARPATPYVKVRSASATATEVRVREFRQR